MSTDLLSFNIAKELSQEDQLSTEAMGARSIKEIDRIIKDPCCSKKTCQMLIAKIYLIDKDELQKTLVNPIDWHPEIIRVAQKKLGDPG